MGTDQLPTQATIDQARATTLCLINRERTQRGLGELADSQPLDQAATGHSVDMVNSRYFEHTSPSGVTLVDRVSSIAYLLRSASWAVGENIAWGETTLGTPAAIVKAWMNSPEHRANILDPRFGDSGIGIAAGIPAAGDQPGATYTQDFGWRG